MKITSESNIHFIVNPVSGSNGAPFDVIGKFMGEAECKTTLHVTKIDHDVAACVDDALKDNPDLVVAYGGDGTVMEVANRLHEHQTPMAIIPGGTANVIAHELNIPVGVKPALDLIFNQDSEMTSLDAGKIGENHFLLRLSMGWEAELSRRPTTEAKSNWGTLAYTQAALEALGDTEPVTYELTLDDDTTETVTGINCSICNIGNVGFYGLSIGLDISPSDGFLNVLILQNNNLQAILDITQNVLAGSLPLDIEERLPHYKAQKVTVQPSSTQRLSMDGEALEKSFPITVECVPNYISILTPKQEEEE